MKYTDYNNDTDSDMGIYDMDIHDVSKIKNSDGTLLFTILRVASGWLYSIDNDQTVFVPYDDRFQPLS